MTYFDQYGRVHDKPTEHGSITSNNSWWYSAIYHKLGGQLEIDKRALLWCFTNLERHPYQYTKPPLSREEYMGLSYLMSVYNLGVDLPNNWNFSPMRLPKFDLIEAIKQLWSIRNKHRNAFWQEGKWQVGHFAFSVPWSDRHTLLRINGKYSLFWMIVHKIAHFMQPENRSSRQLRWFKTGKDLEALLNYHREDSPIYQLAKEGIK